jgi:cAMP phosphodiesterase
MRKADFRARVKKIEIVNRVLTDGWAQSIRVTLEDIELTNENLLEIKQFRPNEQVLVELSPVQVSLFDTNKSQLGDGKPGQNSQELLNDVSDEEEFLNFVDEEPDKENENVVKEWNFG